MKGHQSILLVGCLSLAACASLKSEAPTEATTKPVSANAVSGWQLTGAIGAREQKKGWNASLDWMQHDQNHYQIRLSGPLGGGTVLINKNGDNITFRDGNKTISSTNADTLMQQQTGVRLPVDHLYYWVRGLAAPGATSGELRDANHQLTQFQQAGYTITYPQYMQVNGVALPRKIQLHGNGIVVKMVIRQWNV